jgi:hypothetical protein
MALCRIPLLAHLTHLLANHVRPQPLPPHKLQPQLHLVGASGKRGVAQLLALEQAMQVRQEIMPETYREALTLRFPIQEDQSLVMALMVEVEPLDLSLSLHQAHLC